MEDRRLKFELFFQNLKQLCVNLLQYPTNLNVCKLKEFLIKNDTNEVPLQDFQDYTILPLRAIICMENGYENLQLEAVNCLQFILNHTEIDDDAKFMDLYVQLFSLISAPSDNGQVTISSSEELKTSVLNCIKTLLSSFCNGNSIAEQKFFIPLGHSVFVLLELVEKDKSRSIQISSLDVILNLISCSRKSQATNQEVIQDIGRVFASFLPRISTSITKVLTIDTKQGSKVIEKALMTWSEVLCIAMNDEQIADEEKSLKTGPLKEKTSLPIVTRNNSWLKSTNEKMEGLIQNVCSCLVSHSNWLVRRSLLRWSCSLLMNCMRSLEKCVTNLVEVLLIMTSDDYPDVYKEATENLREVNVKIESQSTNSLKELLEEQLFDLFTRLPRMIRTGSDAQKLAALQLMSAYMRLIGSSLNNIVNFESHLSRLLKCLMHLTEFDMSDVAIIAKRPVSSGYSLLNNFDAFVWKKEYKHFTDDKIIKEAHTICQYLASNADVMVIIDQLIEFSINPAYRNQCILLINFLILSPIFKSPDMARYILEEYTNERLWSSQPYQHQIVHRSFQNIDQMKSESILQVLLLQGIANLAQVTGFKFRSCLINTLYLIFERVGSECVIVSAAAHSTIGTISASCQYKSIKEMIEDNSDYLINMISKKLRRLNSENSDVTKVLRVVVQSCSESILEIFRDTFEEVLFLLDHHQGHAYVVLETLHSVVWCISSWKKTTDVQQHSSSEETEMKNNPESDKVALRKIGLNVNQFLLEYHEQTQLVKKLINVPPEHIEGLSAEHFKRHLPEDDRNDNIDKTDNDDMEKVPPTFVKFIVKILKRCVHRISDKDPQIRMLVLDTVMLSAQTLVSYQDDLLPMIHQIWPGFVHRFSDEKPYVLMKAFECLITFSEVCGEFVKQRVLKSIWQKLLTFVQNQATISLNKGKSAAYKFTHEYKFQLLILKEIPKLASQLLMQEEEFSRLCAACVPCINCYQPEMIQKAAIDLFLNLSQQDPHIVWFCLNHFHQLSYVPNSAFASQVKRKQQTATGPKEYDNNVALICGALDFKI